MAKSKIQKLKNLVLDVINSAGQSRFTESTKNSAHFHEGRLHRNHSSHCPHHSIAAPDFSYQADREAASYESLSHSESAWW